MCGIAGAIEYLNKTQADFSANESIHQSIARRGPDNYQFCEFQSSYYRLVQAHSRLSILDLSNLSNQPFVSFDKRFVLSFNGEIYNFIEIRNELILLGYQFKTSGDTEVLINAWIHWGEASLDKFNGMFAIAIHDKQENAFYLIRDRFGVKPILYHFDRNHGFYYSSSTTSFKNIIDSKINLDYISNGYFYGVFEGFNDFSIYENLIYLTPGSILKINLNDSNLSFSIRKWYCLSTRVNEKIEQLHSLSYQNLAQECYFLIQNAIELRMRSDVPVAVSLSGGIDSSSIAAIASEIIPNLTGFTYGSPYDASSEGQQVKEFANSKGIDVHYIWLENKKEAIIKAFNETFEAQELPFFGLSIMAQNQVYKAVKTKNIKVLLGGQGGDEIFAGYRKFFIQVLKNSIYQKNIEQSVSHLYSLGVMLINESKNYNTFWTIKERYFNPNNLNTGIFNFLPFNSISLIGDKTTSLSKRQILDVLQNSLPTLLRYEDRNSMYYSIESRLPFLDYRLVEFAIALPELAKIKNGMGKWLLRDTMREKVPHSILFNKQKRGFDVTQKWMQLGLEDYLIEEIMKKKNQMDTYDFKINNQVINHIKQKKSQLKIADLMLLYYLTHHTK